MSIPRSFPIRGLPPRAAALLVAALAAGCGDSSGVGTTYPVTGKITVNDKLLTAASTIVLFKPDKARGNTSLFEPATTVDDQGNYTLSTKGKAGAPPGWYKVIVTATEVLGGDAKRSAHKRPGPQSLLSPRYGQAATTPVAIEVVESPGPSAYDIKLTSK